MPFSQIFRCLFLIFVVFCWHNVQAQMKNPRVEPLFSGGHSNHYHIDIERAAIDLDWDTVFQEESTKRKARTTGFFFSAAIFRLLSRSAYSAYEGASTPRKASLNYSLANSCHKASLLCLGATGVSFVIQIGKN